MAPDSVRPCGVGHWLGKTFYMAEQGGGVVDVAAQAVGKHPLPIPSSREWFALFILCKGVRLFRSCRRLVLLPNSRAEP